jgi:hypothetical protein
VGLSTGWELGNGEGLLGATDLGCGGTGLLAGGGFGVGGFGLGAGGGLGMAFLGLNFFGLGVAAACAFWAAACLACAITADHTLSDISLQSAT